MNTGHSMELFRDRTAVLATKHRKETVIAPILEAELGLRVIVPGEFDSDRFGTFTREVKRLADQRQTARLKAEQALKLTGAEIAIASEGAFGPHPAMPFVPCDRELVLLLDAANQLEVVGEELSTQTNYQQQWVASLEEAIAFAEQVGFPQHGLIVRPSPDSTEDIHKGIVDEDQLAIALERSFSSTNGKAWMETDMRALYNPTRMGVITNATHHLVQCLQQTCPVCDFPGFTITRRVPGLRCAWCQSPTSLIAQVIQECRRCGHTQTSPNPDAQVADPIHCPMCNP